MTQTRHQNDVKIAQVACKTSMFGQYRLSPIEISDFACRYHYRVGLGYLIHFKCVVFVKDIVWIIFFCRNESTYSIWLIRLLTSNLYNVVNVLYYLLLSNFISIYIHNVCLEQISYIYIYIYHACDPRRVRQRCT